jgi:mannose-6-phosphate isomerase-like protein (cupin superfamily)
LPLSDAFEVGQIAARLRAENGGYEVFHASPSIDLGVYVLVAPEPDRQQPHEWDEIYLVLEGHATLTVEDEAIPLGVGEAAYVKAGAKHRFTDYESVSLLVVFDKTQTA